MAVEEFILPIGHDDLPDRPEIGCQKPEVRLHFATDLWPLASDLWSLKCPSCLCLPREIHKMRSAAYFTGVVHFLFWTARLAQDAKYAKEDLLTNRTSLRSSSFAPARPRFDKPFGYAISIYIGYRSTVIKNSKSLPCEIYKVTAKRIPLGLEFIIVLLQGMMIFLIL